MHTYKIRLQSCGDCSRMIAAELMDSLLGYNRKQALFLVRTAPVNIIEHLDHSQAEILARILDECGLDVEIMHGNEPVQVSYVNRTVFRKDGSLRNTAMQVLSELSGLNRMENGYLPGGGSLSVQN